MNKKMLMFTLLVLTLCLGCLTGCGDGRYNNSATHPGGAKENVSAKGGTLHLKGDAEFAITYDKNGRVTDVTARNDKGREVLSKFTAYEGKEARKVVAGLATAMGQAGHFTTEEGQTQKNLSLEIQKDSKQPHNGFLDDLVKDVRDSITAGNWSIPLMISGASIFGLNDDRYNNSVTDPAGNGGQNDPFDDDDDRDDTDGDDPFDDDDNGNTNGGNGGSTGGDNSGTNGGSTGGNNSGMTGGGNPSGMGGR